MIPVKSLDELPIAKHHATPGGHRDEMEDYVNLADLVEGEQDSDPTWSGYDPQREVAQYRLALDWGSITEAEFEAARERLEGAGDA